MKSKTIGLAITLLTLSLIVNLSINSKQKIESQTEIINKKLGYINNLKSSAFSGKIHIDNNWSATKTAGICKGNGTYSEPYVIDDLVIDGGGSGSCISIENSDAYFKIENCTLYNSGRGIRLSEVTNAQLIDNNCSSNFQGIFLISSSNNTVSGNTANFNYLTGITFYSNCYYNSFSNNTVSNNGHWGIYISGDYNNVSGNIVCSNNWDGIILALNSDRNTFSDNNASFNKRSGIIIEAACDFNFLLGNTVRNNSFAGIILDHCQNNIIKGNFIIKNDVGIYIIYTLHYRNNFKKPKNEISNNVFNGNNQDIQESINIIRNPYEPLMSSISMLLSIAIGVVVITSLTVELIRKQKDPREGGKYHPPIYGISALTVESLGALIFILGAIFLIFAGYLLFWYLILIPFSLVGIIISRIGVNKDATKFLAKLGLFFGIVLLILSFSFFVPVFSYSI